ncbi:hypothetical protein CRENBAI_005016 [Crenichthys baileyi]|uniref:Uncharacterized protein n=1 Tax=Crenichthys baileyi TaxID=28760 RepID=A0AAV9QZ56_9TELE
MKLPKHVFPLRNPEELINKVLGLWIVFFLRLTGPGVPPQLPGKPFHPPPSSKILKFPGARVATLPSRFDNLSPWRTDFQPDPKPPLQSSVQIVLE